MHESLQDIKLWLIHEISGSENEALLHDLKTQVEQHKQRYIYEPTPVEAEAALLMLAAEPNASYEIDLEEIMREQGTEEPDKEGLYQILEEMDVQEPIEEMLALLSK